MASYVQVNWRQKVLEWYVFGSFHIGAGAASLTYFTFRTDELSLKWYYIGLVAFATIGLYSLHRLIGINRSQLYESLGRFAVINKYQTHIMWYFIISSIIGSYCFYYVQDYIHLMLPGGIVGLAYVLPFKGRRLRDFAWLKLFLIAFSWTWLCVLLPQIIINRSTIELIITSFSCFFFFIGITLPFDIRDVLIDTQNGVKTIPQALGLERSWKLSMISIILSAMIWLLGNSFQVIAPDGNTWNIVCAASILVLLNHKKHVDDEMYYSFWLDGTLVLFGSVYAIMH